MPLSSPSIFPGGSWVVAFGSSVCMCLGGVIGVGLHFTLQFRAKFPEYLVGWENRE